MAGAPADREQAALAARWGLGLLAVAAVITDTPTSYQAVTRLPPGFTAPATMHPVNQLPAFITEGLYRRYLHPGEIVVILTHRGNAGMLFQADADFYFRIAGGYINASLTPVRRPPYPVDALAHPSQAAIRMFEDYVRSSGMGAIIVEQAWEEPWMLNLSKTRHARHVGRRRDHLPRQLAASPWLSQASSTYRKRSACRNRSTNLTARRPTGLRPCSA